MALPELTTYKYIIEGTDKYENSPCLGVSIII